MIKKKKNVECWRADSKNKLRKKKKVACRREERRRGSLLWTAEEH